MHSVGQPAAAIRIVAWVTRGALRPASDDFAILRLALLALLPQIGGITAQGGAIGEMSSDQSGLKASRKMSSPVQDRRNAERLVWGFRGAVGGGFSRRVSPERLLT